MKYMILIDNGKRVLDNNGKGFDRRSDAVLFANEIRMYDKVPTEVVEMKEVVK